MTERNQVYRCAICGNIVEVKHAGAGELVCCGQPMKLLSANVEDAATEKHVPVIERTDEGIVVNIGAVDHPMDSDHYIEWIEIVIENKTYTVYLAPGDAPRAIFDSTAESVTAYAYCNLHGLWKSEA
ncbi:MAG: desulfoferrodoxin [Parcubacteria group bacterium]|jgi:superoxide reductase